MKVWTCNRFGPTVWRTGSAVVVADNAVEAAMLLHYRLLEESPDQPMAIDAEWMEELPMEPGTVLILDSGEY